MRLNQYVARSTGLSRRAADTAIADGRVAVNGVPATLGFIIKNNDKVSLDGCAITPPVNRQLILLNKPPGYVCSRDGQGGSTIYELLPGQLHNLKPIGRLDKYSSGLLLLTDDGQLSYELTHPKFGKDKIYKIALNKPLSIDDQRRIATGVMLDDGLSRLKLEQLNKSDLTNWKVIMHEGRNRQIRRTFAALGYSIPKLHRTKFGHYILGTIKTGSYQILQ